MKKLNVNEMRAIEGGASKYVTCPYCHYRRKTSVFERLFQSNTRIEYYMETRHYKAMSGYNGSQDVHQ